MTFEEKIVDKNLTLYCSSNLKLFADEFKSYFYKNINKIKNFLDITEPIELVIALTELLLIFN